MTVDKILREKKKRKKKSDEMGHQLGISTLECGLVGMERGYFLFMIRA